MAAHALRKVSRDAVGYTVVDLSDVRHVFAAATPRRDGTLREQAADALWTIAATIGEHGQSGSIVHQAVFLRNIDQAQELRQIMREFYGPDMPATEYIPQPPCDGKLLAIEAMGVGRGLGEVQITRISEQLVIESHNGITWVHAAHAVPQNDAATVYDQTHSALVELQRLLGAGGAQLSQVIRTWLYLGGIVDPEGETQRYKELNRSRADLYRDVDFLADRLPAGRYGHGPTVFPASTGIGTEGRQLSISAMALATDRKDILAVPLENPRQTAAYDYSGKYSPKSPKFSRAMALSCGQYATILISGTASITASETVHVGDAVGQAHETLDNIAALISEENLARHGLPGMGTTLEGMGMARVYIKRPEDYAAVRAAVGQRLGEMPIIYAVADVCRPDLLVEIEGMAFSRKQ